MDYVLCEKCLLSPYLFIFVSDVLSYMIKDAIHKKELKGLRMNKSCPLLSHLFFVDDAVFFIEATDSNVLQLKNILQMYYFAIGQAVNYQKSSILFSKNVLNRTRNSVGVTLGLPIDARPSRYLGIPME